MRIISTVRFRRLLLIIVTVMLGGTMASAALKTFSGTGNWTDGARWTGGIAATAADSVIVASGATCTINTAAECLVFIVQTGATATNVSISASNSLTVGGGTGTVTINANGTNNVTSVLSAAAGTMTCGTVSVNQAGGSGRNQLSLSTGTVTITGNLTMGGNKTSLIFSGSGTLHVSESFALGAADFTPSTGTISFNGTGSQTITGATYSNVRLAGSGTKTLGGTTTVSTKLTRAGTATFATGGQTYASGTTFEYAGSASQTTGAELPTSVTNLIINNPSGVNLNATQTVTGTLTLTSGNVITGSNILNANGTVSRTSGHVVGNLQKQLTSSTTTPTFEVGTSSSYLPINLSFASITTTGNLLASATSNDHSSISGSGINSARSVNAFWTLTNNVTTPVGFTSYGATFNFTASEIDGGATTDSFVVKKFNSPTWTSPTTETRTSTSTQATGLTSFSDFAIGELTKYTLTVNATNGSVTKNPDQSNYDAASSVQLTATPNTGYEFSSWSGDASGSTNPLTVTMDANKTITANFSIITYTITASAGAGGSISPTGAVSVGHGNSQAFAITPDPEYHVLELLVDGNPTDSTMSYTFSNVTADHTIEASFQPDSFTITATAGAGGSISPSGIVSVVAAGSQAFGITPDAGYHLLNLTVDSTPVDSTTSYTFDNVSADHTIEATFEINTYTLTIDTSGSGTVSANPTQSTYDHGTDVELTATPSTGYTFDGWSGDASGTTNPLTVTMTSDMSITAAFSINVYTISASAGSGGSISPVGSVSVNHGDDQAFTFSPDAGYHFRELLVDNVSVDSTTSYTFTNVTADHTIEARYEIHIYTITAIAGANGSLTPSGTVTVNEGDDETFSIEADTGYHVSDLFVDSVSLGARASYTFTSVSSNHSIEAIFAINTYTLTVNASNGSVTKNPNQATYEHGETVELDAIPDAGFLFVGWTGDTTSSANPLYVIMNTDVLVNANFAAEIETIFVSAGPNGSISPTGTVLVLQGSDTTFSITPSVGYHVDDVLVDGGSIGEVSTYTFSNVTGSHTLSATFERNTFIHSILDGNWNSAATWSFNRVPLTSDSVIISSNDTVALNVSATVSAITVVGRLRFDGQVGRTLTTTTSGGTKSARVQILGALAFGAGNSQRVNVAGSFECTGLLVNTSLGTDGSQIAFSGSGIKRISSSAIIRSLRLNNANLDLIMDSPLTISSEMSFTNGKIRLGSFNLLVGSLNATSPGSSSSYVIIDSSGKLGRSVGTITTSFPIGTATSYNPITLKTGAGSDVFSVGVGGTISPSTGNDNAAVQRMWTISENVSGGNGSMTLTMQWNASDQGSTFTPASAVSWRYDGTSWVETGTATGPPAGSDPYILTIVGLSQFSNYIIGNPGALPVRLSSLSAGQFGPGEVLVEWTTLTDQSVLGFYVERRGEAQDEYSQVSELIAVIGDGVGELQYAWKDSLLETGEYRYRLLIVGSGGEQEYSHEIVVSVTGIAGLPDGTPLLFGLGQNFPNPFNPVTTISFVLENESDISLAIFDVLGREIDVILWGTLLPGQHSVQFDGSETPSGMYLYRLTSKDHTGLRTASGRMLLLK